ncbi:hypothetical protein, partial [Streptomyces neyagawaensis]|uniref:hypothetical protein n=1 Tax=Streptomyces neyagawaensis TaxID=42238 RepID=UPI00197EF9E1
RTPFPADRAGLARTARAQVRVDLATWVRVGSTTTAAARTASAGTPMTPGADGVALAGRPL